MLQKLNERIQGVIAWVVILLIAATFTLFGVDYYLQNHQTSNAKALVNDIPITNQAFDLNYRRARAQQDLEQMTSSDEKNLQNQVLEQMISNEVTVQSAKHYGFDVSVNQANSAIVSIAQFQEDGHFSSERYQQALNAALFTPESFQNEVRQGMLLNQQRFAFMGSSFALPSEIERFVRLYMQTRDYEYLTIPAQSLENNNVPSPQQISDYYKQHKKEFMSPEQVTVDYITLSVRDIRAKIKISDEDISRYYTENQNNYLTPAQWKVAHILFAVPEDASTEEKEHIKKKADDAYKQLLKKPNDFAIMLSLSDDKLSISQQGELPWITAGQNDYDRALSPLTQIGQISKPVETKHGYELFKLLDYRPVTTKSLTEMKTTIEEQLAADMVQSQYAQALEQLSDLSYQTPDSLVPVAEALGLKINHSQPFSRLSGEDPISANKQVVNTAFSHDVLELGNNSEPIQLNNDEVVVLRVNKHFTTKSLSLSKVAEQIKTRLTKRNAQQQAKEIGTYLLNPVADEKQQQVITAHQLKWQTVTKATRDGEQIDTLVNDLAFNLLRPESRDGTTLTNGDYVVVKLKAINNGILSELDKEQQDSLIQQIEASYGMMDYDLYVNNLVKQAKVAKY